MSGSEATGQNLTSREKARALYRVAMFQPLFATGLILLAVFAALLEGVGLMFIEPIIQLAQSATTADDPSRLFELFLFVYELLGIPFTLGYLVAGVALIMFVRYTMSFLVGWFRAAIETRYVRYLQEEAFTNALDARVAYFDEEGSDDILNAIVTQAEYAGQVIRYAIHGIEQGLLSVMYLVVAFYISPVLTVITVGFLGLVTVVFRNTVDMGYSIGDRVADAKERIQSNAQAGTQGIKEVKLFGLIDELRSGFVSAVDQFEQSRIKLLRNESAITNFYQFTTAVTVFVLIYFALTFSAMSVGELGVFLFAMFKLGPKVSELNTHIYRVDGELPHLVRTQRFIENLQENREIDDGSEPTPGSFDRYAFDDVTFSYDTSNEMVLRDISFDIDHGEFVAFVGPSGAGKSTVASLFARMYEPDDGEITAGGIPIDRFDLREWRSNISIVRQDPHIFNETLRRNITVGKREASDEEVERAADIAQVTEFLEELPEGYDTVLGEQGVKLSGGQRQRVALARALVKDAELLILDEATSDLDTSLERSVHTGIEEMERDYTMLVIAHRLSTVTNADRIYSMKDGEIVESGTHSELIERSGQYAQLYSPQSR